MLYWREPHLADGYAISHSASCAIDHKKAGRTENLEELLRQSDKVHAMTEVNCKTPE